MRKDSCRVRGKHPSPSLLKQVRNRDRFWEHYFEEWDPVKLLCQSGEKLICRDIVREEDSLRMEHNRCS